MRVYGNASQAVTRENDRPFEGFETKSGRDIHSDLARAHDKNLIKSPIKLAPLTPQAERALTSGSKATPSRVSAPRPDSRKPATPARLPAPGPVTPAATPVDPRPSAARPRDGGGQTTPRQTTRDVVAQRHTEGFTAAEIAGRLRLSQQSVHYHLRMAGLTPNRRSRAEYDYEALVTYYSAGHSIPSTAAHFGCSARSVRNALDLYHVPRRDDRRALLTEPELIDRHDPTIPAPTLAEFVLARLGWSDAVMRRYASTHAAHPDYQQEWKP